MVSLVVHNAHPHDHFASIARIDSETMASIGAVEGDILEIVGKRKTVAKCKPLEKQDAARNPNTIWLTKTVRNNAEVPFGASVEVAKAQGVFEAKRIVIAPSHVNEASKYLEQLQIKQHLPSLLSGSPVLPGDYVVTLQPMGGSWIVFEIMDIGTTENSGKSPALISKNTSIEVKQIEGERPRRGYPVFWVNVQDGVRKVEQGVFLVMNFSGLHYDGRFGGQFERKVAGDTDIQTLVSRYAEVAQRETDSINEEARTATISAESVKNRILQRWMKV